MQKLAFHAAGGALAGIRLLNTGRRAKRKIRRIHKQLNRRLHPVRVKENEIIMKKSTLGIMAIGVAAAAGAVAAGAFYLYRREKELDEYEKLLFDDEFEEETSGEQSEEPEENGEDEVEVEISLEDKPEEEAAEEPAEEETKD